MYINNKYGEYLGIYQSSQQYSGITGSSSSSISQQYSGITGFSIPQYIGATGSSASPASPTSPPSSPSSIQYQYIGASGSINTLL